MPLLEADTLAPVGLAPQFGAAEPEAPATYSWLEIGEAALRDNTLVSFFLDAKHRNADLMLDASPGYEIGDDDFAGYEGFESDLVWAKSPAHLARIKQRIDDERQAHEVLGNSGWAGLAASLGSGIIDPVNLIPVGGSLARSATIGRRMWESTKLAGRAGLLSSVAGEAVLQNTQMTRDTNDALFAIGASTFLSGALGAGVGLLAPANRAAIGEAFKRDVLATRAEFLGPQGGGGSGGAAAARTETLADVTLTGAGGIEKLQAHGAVVGTPLGRLVSSPVLEARQVARELAETAYHFEGEAKGIAAPQAVETKVKGWQGNLYRGLKALDEAFLKHRFGEKVFAGRLRAGVEDVTGQASPNQLSHERFKARVAYAMRRKDQDPGMPEVAQAARDLRREVFDPLKAQAIELELLPPNIEPSTADSYLTRLFDTERITARRGDWDQRVFDYFARARDHAKSEGGAKAKKWKTLADNAQANVERTEKVLQELDDAVVKEPTRLASWLVKQGGLRDHGGELKAMDARIARPGLVNSKGLPFDEAARMAQDAGYLPTKHGPDGPERATINDLLDALRDDLAGFNRYSEADAIQLEAFRSTDKAKLKAARESLIRERNASRRQATRYANMVDEHQDLMQMTDADLKDMVRQMTDDLLHRGGAAYRDLTVNIRGSLKPRTFHIPDKMIEDFLENDIDRIARSYVRQMSADIELARAFGRPDMSDQLDEVRRGYAKARVGVDDPKALKVLDQRMADDVADVEAMRDRLRGTYGAPRDPNSLMVRGFRVARGVNYMRLLGGATLSSLADVGSIAMRHGMGRVFSKGLAPFMTNLKAVRMSMDEVRRVGTALDVVLDTRAHSIAEIGDDFGRHSKFERAIQWGQNKFGLLNLLSGWTAVMKQVDGLVSQTRILEDVEKWAKGTATKKAQKRLAWLGIDFDMATRINLMAQKHAQVDPGIRVANTLRWDDREAVDALRAALAKDIDTSIVTPGIGDRPLWMSSEWGKVVGQFRSFTLAATSRITAEGFQRRDWEVLQGISLMVALGMLSYWTKMKLAGREVSDDPEVWIKEGVDRSGVTGVIFEGHNMLEKLLGVTLVGDAPSSRFAGRNWEAAIGGPTVDAGGDVIRILNRIADGEWTAADTHRVRKALPANNVFWLRGLFDAIEEGVNEGLDVPDRRKAKR